MYTIKTNVMRRIQRIYILKKVSIKTLLLLGLLVLARHFMSVKNIAQNALRAIETLNPIVLYEFLYSMFTHTEFLTHVSMGIITVVIIWIVQDIRNINMYKIEIQ